APGILVATAMQTGVFDASYPVLGAIKWDRQFHAMLATPVRVRDVVAGNLAGITLRALLGGAVFLVVSSLLGAIPSWTGVLAIVAVLLVTVAYAAPMFALSANAQTDTSFTMVFRLGVIPMFLFSGTFFPVSQLPDALQPVAYVIPLWHGSSLARDATLGTLSWAPDLLHVGYLLLWAVVGYWLAARVLRRRMVV
ncbi:MAG TPA: ABC transporter permease, partial [Candidatus Nanopelagicales bacterium]|nr:ABC transporter permease [Candidatus Nanopelagicales bacterium]